MDAADVHDVCEEQLVGCDVRGVAGGMPDAITSKSIAGPVGGETTVGPDIGLGGGKFPDRYNVDEGRGIALAR